MGQATSDIFDCDVMCPENDVNLSLNTSVISRACRLNSGHVCAFGRVDKTVLDGKPPAGNTVDSFVS